MKFIEIPEEDANAFAAALDQELQDVPRVNVGGGIHVPPEQRVRLSYVSKLPSETKGMVRVPVHEKIEKLSRGEMLVKLPFADKEVLASKIALAVAVVEEKITLDLPPPKEETPDGKESILVEKEEPLVVEK